MLLAFQLYIAISSILGTLLVDDRALWDAVVAGAKTNLEEADYSCRFTFRGGLARTYDEALNGDFRRLSSEQLGNGTAAIGRVCKLGDCVRYRIEFTNRTDYRDGAPSYSMRSDDQMIGRGMVITYIPPQQNIFDDLISAGVIRGLKLSPNQDRFQLSHHNTRLNDSAMWGNRNLLYQLSPSEGADPVTFVKLLERSDRVIQFQIESPNFSWQIVEFDVEGEYPVLSLLHSQQTHVDQLQMIHQFSDIQKTSKENRVPLAHRFISGPREIVGSEQTCWEGTSWEGTDFLGDSSEADFEMIWPNDTTVAGHLPKNIQSFNLFSSPLSDLPIDTRQDSTSNSDAIGSHSWTLHWQVILAVALILVITWRSISRRR